jgi:cytochrome c-type biogenesis protein CcmH/NrfG
MAIHRTAILTLALAANVTKAQLFLTTLALAGALLLAALIIKLADRWRKQQKDDILTPQDQLAEFEQLHWKGELSKEEFERIQARLTERLGSGKAPAKPAAPSSGPDAGHQPPEPPETGIRPQPPG